MSFPVVKIVMAETTRYPPAFDLEGTVACIASGREWASFAGRLLQEGLSEPREDGEVWPAHHIMDVTDLNNALSHAYAFAYLNPDLNNALSHAYAFAYLNPQYFF